MVYIPDHWMITPLPTNQCNVYHVKTLGPIGMGVLLLAGAFMEQM